MGIKQIAVTVKDYVSVVIDPSSLKWLMGFIFAILLVALATAFLLPDTREKLICATFKSYPCLSEASSNEIDKFVDAVAERNIAGIESYIQSCEEKNCLLKESAQQLTRAWNYSQSIEKALYEAGETNIALMITYLEKCSYCSLRLKALEIIKRAVETGSIKSASVQTLLKSPLIKNGSYRVERGYIDPKRPSQRENCLGMYPIVNVKVADGQLEFTSDGRTWSGSINQQTGIISIDSDGIKPALKHPTTIQGKIFNAALFNGYCGRGFFRLVGDSL